jgi:ubiquinone/menaquinone biosynthesis C-methylase UbiE
MDELHPEDVPYGNDWDSEQDVAAWASEADLKRPWREQIRELIARRVATLSQGARILELGSGPGFLARRVLDTCPNVTAYTLVDFSEPMLALSRERLALHPAASFVLASFKAEDWPRRVDAPFDCVLSMQAIHELRNKQHAVRLYGQVYRILATPGLIMICDHIPFGPSRNTTLYMTEQEQQDTLAKARFSNVHVELRVDSLVLYAGHRNA